MKRFFVIALALTLAFNCAGCGLLAPLTGHWPNSDYADQEDQIFEDTVDAFLAAVDSRDPDAVAALFSEEARAGDLMADIGTLFSAYTEPTAYWYFDGLTSGNYSNEHGTKTSELTARFPIFAGEDVFWCRLTVRYLDAENEENEGITCVNFYTGADFGSHWYEEDYKHPEEPGLTVCWEHPSEIPIRCIKGIPYQFTARNEPLNETEVLVFMQDDPNIEDFLEYFGEPCAHWSGSYIYELPDENGEKRYLDVLAGTERIWSISVVSELEWLRSVWDN